MPTLASWLATAWATSTSFGNTPCVTVQRNVNPLAYPASLSSAFAFSGSYAYGRTSSLAPSHPGQSGPGIGAPRPPRIDLTIATRSIA